MNLKIRRILFVILARFSYCLRIVSHKRYMGMLLKAYKILGIKFKGKPTYIDYRSFIDNLGDITLGDNIVISTNVIILAHDYSPKVIKKIAPPPNSSITSCKLAPVIIGDDCFIGAGAIILPGTTIGKSCIIGAGAVVKGRIPDYSVVIGNPSKILKKLK